MCKKKKEKTRAHERIITLRFYFYSRTPISMDLALDYFSVYRKCNDASNSKIETAIESMMRIFDIKYACGSQDNRNERIITIYSPTIFVL